MTIICMQNRYLQDCNKLEQLNSKAELLVVKLDNLLDEVEEHNVKTAIKQFYKNI